MILIYKERNLNLNKRISSRAVIIENEKILTMFRRKREKRTVDIEILGHLGSDEYDTTVDHFFAAKIINGIPKLGGEELERMTEDNYYECRYVDLKELDSTDINSKDKIQNAIDKKYIPL